MVSISAEVIIPGNGSISQSITEHTRSPAANWWRTAKLRTAAPACAAIARNPAASLSWPPGR
jgi:hypothetical protein